MQAQSPMSDTRITGLSLKVAFHIALAALLVIWCFIIVKPFLLILAWSVILAVAFNGLFEKLVGMVGGKRGLAATVFSLGAVLLIVVPSYFIGGSLAGSIGSVRESMAAGTLEAPPPPEAIQNLPLVGERVFAAMQLAHDDLQEAVVQFEPQLRSFGTWFLGFLAGVGGTVLKTLLALIIASVFLTYKGPAIGTLRAITNRIEGDFDEDFVGMAGATINSVATGVLGVAFIQAAFLGVGLFLSGIPAPGLITLVAFVTAIVQIPMLLIMLGPIIWGFANLGILWAIVFAVFAIVGSLADAPLKAIFLGRGVPVPSLVILMGAIGGMVSMGMMGLFLGAVVLGIGYRLYQFWLNRGEMPETTVPEAAAT